MPETPETTLHRLTREKRGQIVREAWVEWAKEQADPKPSWLVPWLALSDADKEADMRIGDALAATFTPLLEAVRDALEISYTSLDVIGGAANRVGVVKAGIAVMLMGQHDPVHVAEAIKATSAKGDWTL